MFQRT